MGKQRDPRGVDPTIAMARKIRELEDRIAKMEGSRVPTVPRYDLSTTTENTPPAAIEGQVAQDVQTNTAYHYWHGQWYPMSSVVQNGPWFYVGGGTTHDGFTEPDFENSWVNIDDFVATRFRINGLGELELDIAVQDGDDGSVVFTFPTDFFTFDGDREFPVSDGYGGTADVYINSSTREVYWSLP